MNKDNQSLKLKELRKKFSKKPEILDKIKTIEGFNKKYKIDILLIDDDPVGNAMYSTCIEGYNKVNKITSITCAKEALNYLQELHEKGRSFPKLILLDVEMPELNGGDFLEFFKNNFPRKRTKIIIFTSHDKEKIEKELEYNRVIGYLPKHSFSMNTLESLILRNFD